MALEYQQVRHFQAPLLFNPDVQQQVQSGSQEAGQDRHDNDDESSLQPLHNNNGLLSSVVSFCPSLFSCLFLFLCLHLHLHSPFYPSLLRYPTTPYPGYTTPYPGYSTLPPIARSCYVCNSAANVFDFSENGNDGNIGCQRIDANRDGYGSNYCLQLLRSHPEYVISYAVLPRPLFPAIFSPLLPSPLLPSSSRLN